MSFDSIVSKFTQVEKQLQEEGQEMLMEKFEEVFKAYPELTVVKWHQYTPYFNDGEPCEFSVGSFNVSNAPDIENVTSWDDYEGEEEGVFVTELWGKNKDYPILSEISSFASSTLGKSLFYKLFGDHVEVIVTPDGIDTEEYDHD